MLQLLQPNASKESLSEKDHQFSKYRVDSSDADSREFLDNINF